MEGIAYLVVNVSSVSAAKILAVKVGTFISQACLPCHPPALFMPATSPLVEVIYLKK
jgi:hypothetical protein